MTVAWVTPKTNWYGYTTPAGIYSGDYFTYVDFNRIKNNLDELKTIAEASYTYITIPWNSLGADRAVNDLVSIDDMNAIEENLDHLNSASVSLDIGSVRFTENTALTFQELNRIESACLSLYEEIANAAAGRRKFTWNFGKGIEI